jgi:peptidoglycan lytic transglycosylase
MSAIRNALRSQADHNASRIDADERIVSCTRVRQTVQWGAVLLAAATLAGCAQSSLVSGTPEQLTTNQAVSSPQPRKTSSLATRARVAAAKKKRIPVVAIRRPSGTLPAAVGVASFYTEGEVTANGEKFDTHELTAAHRTLPFGTRLRVTNIATGQSVTVRINDRGPFIPGRVVDVSYSAAETLGMVDKGITKVKLDVVKDSKEAAKEINEAAKETK